jgi:hypothetical protein
MQRGLLVTRVLCAVILIGWGTLGLAIAAEELGQFCWRLEPFVDTVRLSVTVNGPMFHLLASWRAGPAPANWTIGGERNDTRETWYDFLGTGTGRASIDPRDPPGSINIGIVASKVSGFASEFSGQPICSLRMLVTLPSLNAFYTVACPIGPERGPPMLSLSPQAIFHPCSGNE